LFQAEPKDFEINGLKMDGVLFNCPVKVFSQKGYLTEEYIDQLHDTVGEYIKARMFIIAPASRVYFLQDYIEKDGIRYYVLRIPYSVIDELHKRAFTRPLQPTSAKDINQNIEQVGFDFVHPPNVKAEYFRRKPKDKLIEEELIIEIKEFEAVQRAKEPVEFKDPKDALSMVLIDRDYNGKFFNMTDYFFADDIKKEGYKVRIPAEKVGEKVCIIYLDIFGNERIEVKEIKEFKR
jgi:site-specific DNA-methyltransferase (adenine-specific)/adenine-specific DNA-methyltransferase